MLKLSLTTKLMTRASASVPRVCPALPDVARLERGGLSVRWAPALSRSEASFVKDGDAFSLRWKVGSKTRAAA